MSEPVRVALRTLGCKVNRVESETVAAELLGRGALVVAEEDADVVIVNTCTVTGEADAKARKAVRRALGQPRGPLVVVTGCLATLGRAMLEDLDPRVVVETDKAKIADRLSERLHLPSSGVRRPRSGPSFRTRAMLKIEDGCDAFCAYCIVPYARGIPKSVPLPDLRREAGELASAGAVEIVLTGINLGRYNHADAGLADVIEAVASSGVPRLRLSSIEPLDLTDNLLTVLSRTPGVCPHLHVPLQSGSDRVLEAMGRKYATAAYGQRIARARERIPGLAVTTDVIVGFPGETEEDVEATIAFCERIGFAKLHVFRFSAREGTPAAVMRDQVPPHLRKQRAAAVQSEGDRLRERFLHSMVGIETEVLVERLSGTTAIGTSPEYASVCVECAGARVGDVVLASVCGVDGDVLLGRAP